jgi:pyruvate kinase
VKKEGLGKKGDITVITFGTPIGVTGSTNLMNVVRIN